MATEVNFRQLLEQQFVRNEQLQAALRKFKQAQHEPIAIVGMGCRYPGGADGPEAYWELLEQGKDAVREVPDRRWAPEELEGAPACTKWAGYLEGVDGFDAGFFGISPREAASLDPQQRLVLEVAWEALEDAGIAPSSLLGKRVGVFMGAMSHDYGDAIRAGGAAALDTYTASGTTLCFTAGRLSYVMGLQGPAMSVDTACSSSLVAVHLGCQSLRAAESEVALVGGVNLLLSPLTMQMMAQMQALSPDGKCKTFDAGANGFVRGEGCGVLVLKRLSDAQRDGDRIWAVVKGSAVNQDGRSTGLTTPNVLAQQELLRQALKSAQLQAGDIGYVEAHGTGTSLGDPIEVEALKAVLGPRRADGSSCLMGSVKTNVGHLEAAAGAAGLMKAVLALNKQAIPRHLHFRTLNPRISLEGTSLAIPVQTTAWPKGEKPRFAGISSFGISGTNAHVIVGEAPEAAEGNSEAGEGEEEERLLVVSGRTQEAVKGLAGRYAKWLGGWKGGVGEVAYTAAVGRSHQEERVAVVGRSAKQWAQQLEGYARGEGAEGLVAGRVRWEGAAKVAFVFSGQGAQWEGMGRQLLKKERVFREAVEQCAEEMEKEGVKLLEELERGQWGGIEVVQPVLFAMQVGLARLWRSWGVEPQGLVGHSMGEVAAAAVSGALRLEQAVRVICRRSALLKQVSGRGAMGHVELTLEQAKEELRGYEERLAVGVSNGERATVLSGEEQALEEVLRRLEGRGVFCRRVKVDVASHSPQVEELLGPLRKQLEGLEPRAGQVALYSTVEEQVVDGSGWGAEYWCRNLRQPVHFHGAIKRLVGDGYRVLVEVSPHPILVPAMEASVDRKQVVVVGSLRRQQPERAALLESLGELYVSGYPVDFQKQQAGGKRVRLPTYAWQRERHWLEGGQAAPKRVRRAGSGLLGESFTAATQRGTYHWQQVMGGEEAGGYLKQHQVQGAAVLPASAYVEMALLAARQRAGGEPEQGWVVEQVKLTEALVLGQERLVQVSLTEEAGGRYTWRVSSQQEGGGWQLHASGAVRAGTASKQEQEAVEQVRERCGEEQGAEGYYRQLKQMGLEYGPAFQGVRQLWRGAGEALGRVELPEQLAGTLEGSVVHPALLDACLQVLAGAVETQAGPLVPTYVGQVRVYGKPGGPVWSHGRVRQGPAGLEGQVRVLGEGGRVLVEVEQLRLEALDRRQVEKEQRLLTVQWRPSAVPEAQPGPAGGWLVVGGGELGQELARELEKKGARVVQARGEQVASRAQSEELLKQSFPQEAPRGVVHLQSVEPQESLQLAWEKSCGGALHLVQALVGGKLGWRETPRLWLVTRGAQAPHGSVAPIQALVWGLGRSLEMETPELRCARVDVSPGLALATQAQQLAQEVLANSSEEEVALGPEGRLTSRLVRSDWASLPEKQVPVQDRPFRLESHSPGSLRNLVLRPLSRSAPAAGQVEIEVLAAGLNFLDVLGSMGLIPAELMAGGDGSRLTPGMECAGLVTAVGSGVAGLRPGDRVIALGGGALASHVVTSADLVLPLPASLSFEEGATLPIAHLTAYYSLRHVARLAPGERVLIHAAAGGVGIAAVQWAKHVGAEIFATAGSEEKRAFLRSLGVEHVSDSRTMRFVDDVMRWTSGEGVDVVLNSLSGEFIPKSLGLLRDHGRFVELGKRDLLADAQLGLRPFLRNLSFSLVDFFGMIRKRPAIVRGLLAEVMKQVEGGALKPLPVREFGMGEVQEAFGVMAQGQHMGKLVVRVKDERARLSVGGKQGQVRVKEEGSYLVTGGLGGLGLEVAKWLVEQGARQLVLVGRSGAGSEEQRKAVQRLEGQGASVRVEQADVGNREEVAELLERVKQQGWGPVRGVVHTAGVLEDGLVMQQEVSKLGKVMRPKVQGAWNLHELTQGEPLDFFVLYSSAAALLGSPGQSNYAAANAYMDALASYRQQQGKEGLSINWGAFSQVGLAAAQANRGQRLEHRGAGSITPQEGHEVLGRLLGTQVAQVGVMELNLRQWVEFYPHAAGSARLSELLKEAKAGRPAADGALLQKLEGLGPEARQQELQQYVSQQVAQVLRTSVSRVQPTTPLKGLGIDSLMGMELRNRLESSLGLTLSATLVWTHPNVAAISQFLHAQLGYEAAPEPEAAPSQPQEKASEELRKQVETMSRDELADALARELE
jgi:acyl transferase domain-containing protein/acyl carrier protein